MAGYIASKALIAAQQLLRDKLMTEDMASSSGNILKLSLGCSLHPTANSSCEFSHAFPLLDACSVTIRESGIPSEHFDTSGIA